MQPILKSLLAELSPAWLRARKLRTMERAEMEDGASAPARRPEAGVERPKRTQTACHVPARPNSSDIASNM